MIFEYSVILYSDFELEVRMLITMFLYSHHFFVHSTINTSKYTLLPPPFGIRAKLSYSC
jgi:hypothetical protein